MAKKFDAHKAALQIFALMKKMGVKTEKLNNDSWVDKLSDTESRISLKQNTFFVSVTADGVSFMSRAALFGNWSQRTKSRKEFNKHMQHVLFYMR